MSNLYLTSTGAGQTSITSATTSSIGYGSSGALTINSTAGVNFYNSVGTASLGASITTNGILNCTGLNCTGLTITGTLFCTGLTITSGGSITCLGSLICSSSLNMNNNAITGVTSLACSGAITGVTSLNSLTLNGSTISGVTSLSCSGAITGVTSLEYSGTISPMYSSPSYSSASQIGYSYTSSTSEYGTAKTVSGTYNAWKTTSLPAGVWMLNYCIRLGCVSGGFVNVGSFGTSLNNVNNSLAVYGFSKIWYGMAPVNGTNSISHISQYNYNGGTFPAFSGSYVWTATAAQTYYANVDIYFYGSIGSGGVALWEGYIQATRLA